MPKYYNKPQKAEGVNRKVLQDALASWELPMIDIKDPLAVEKRISDYLQYCMEHDAPPSVAGCANWLRVAVSTLESWRTGYRGSPEHQRIAAAFYGTMEEIWARDMHEGNINPVSGIFTGKVFFGYRETQEVVVHHQTQNEISTADLIAQSKMLPGAETLLLPSDQQTVEISPKMDAQKAHVDHPVIEDAKVIDAPEIAIPPPKILEELKYVDDKPYEKTINRKANRERRKAYSEAMKPIRKQKQKEYLKEYYAENKENYNPSRNTPEGREKYNAYMREFQRRKKAERKAQKEAEQAAERAQKELFKNQDQAIPDPPDN